MTRCPLIALTLVACGLVGCASSQQGAAPTREVPLTQTHDLALVNLRADDLRPGMTKAEVYALLGAPAEYGNGTWVYRGEGDAVVVTFDGDRFVSRDSQARGKR